MFGFSLIGSLLNIRPLPSSNHRIYAVLLGELDDLVMLEPQDRLDLFVGKIAGRSDVPDALSHRVY